MTYDAPTAYDAPVRYDGAAAPAPTPTPAAADGISPWGPWKPIRVRPLVRGTVRVSLSMPTTTISGDVLENEDWLLGLPTEANLPT